MQRDFIARARVNGCSSLRLIVVHLFPNVLNTLMVLLSLQVGWLIIVESSLSFLGAGIPPPPPSWGGIIAEGRDYLTRAWWVSLFAGLAIMLTVLAFNLFGDWLRDTLDPRQRQV
jgi:peptide/nickel transport system permease protein